MNPRHQSQRIYAGNSGVYDAVFSEDSGEWFIRFVPWGALAFMPSKCLDFGDTEFSVTGYPSVHAAKLAWERGQVTYQTLEQIGSIA